MLIRSAEPDDALEVARVHVRAWQVGYRELLPSTFLDQMVPEDRARRYDFATRDIARPSTLVAIETGAIVGFATTMPCRDADHPNVGELCALYVDPQGWGRGIGGALIAAARMRLREQGFAHACLWLLAGNTRGERFYQNHGWAPDGITRTEKIWGITVDEVRYRRALGA